MLLFSACLCRWPRGCAVCAHGRGFARQLLPPRLEKHKAKIKIKIVLETKFSVLRTMRSKSAVRVACADSRSVRPGRSFSPQVGGSHLFSFECSRQCAHRQVILSPLVRMLAPLRVVGYPLTNVECSRQCASSGCLVRMPAPVRASSGNLVSSRPNAHATARRRVLSSEYQRQCARRRVILSSEGSRHCASSGILFVRMLAPVRVVG